MLETNALENLGIGKNIGEIRLNICKKCPLYISKFGGMCNNKLWLNIETGEVSTFAKPDFKRGCGCVLEAKVDNPISSCPLDKW